ncbi:hypothetical protein GMDG_01805 [Pseudogymnoascus destructans 20631-21]|uniref:Micro-fibrillar-associated protein 1 C-terminal domain-containing protein n=1 Tax=Pseudogymnoascus destructans (strain ATCC MYA-4855 / 20631-21) TaxID=658429 RepID=L8FXD4_PSED2|nr:hypothetical protein GMDG_01805 [Pseudogymnoascus destructans 20631-21]
MSSRMTANPAKAPRYRPGKVVEEVESSDSEVEEEEQQQQQQQQEQKIPSGPAPKFTGAGGISSDLKKVDLNERRGEAREKEERRVEDERLARKAEEEGFVTESEEAGEEEEEEGSEEESGSGEESSEEEAPRRVMMRPMFVKKDKRGLRKEEDTRPDEERIAEEEERRKKAADEIVEEQIRKDVAAREAGKKNWDDDEEAEDEIDDTDGLDPEAEHAAWKLRELMRIKRERVAIEEREKELEEVERRRNLSAEERKAEDDAHIAKQVEEREGKGKMGFMQKYYHKGAFFQEDAKEAGLDRRDLMGARMADDVVNRELLPQALQMRDMTKLGKKGATKYRDLKSEDTGMWGRFEERRVGGGGGGRGMGEDVDERFRPDEGGRSGANNLPVGERRVPQGPGGGREERGGGRERSPRRERERSRSPRRERERSRSPRRERERSRSREPRRDRDDDRSRRKRTSSRDGGRYDYDKRRRVG